MELLPSKIICSVHKHIYVLTIVWKLLGKELTPVQCSNFVAVMCFKVTGVLYPLLYIFNECKLPVESII